MEMQNKVWTSIYIGTAISYIVYDVSSVQCAYIYNCIMDIILNLNSMINQYCMVRKTILCGNSVSL